MDHRVVADYTDVTTEGSHVKVFVRMRPPDGDVEDAGETKMLELDDGDEKRLMLRDPRGRSAGEHAFAFDRWFDTPATQQDVFESSCRPLCDHVLAGYNACCFAYGQTGSGKTYSMFGEADDARGIIPRAAEYVFASLAAKPARARADTAVVVTFVEIYCDQIRDLGKAYLSLDGSGAPPAPPRPSSGRRASMRRRSSVGSDGYESESLGIHEDSAGNVFVKDLSVIPVSTLEEVLTVVQMGFKRRATYETKMNPVSSRSHTVFTLTVVQKDDSGETMRGMLNLVDLAGSERLSKTESEGQRLREALSINSSLSALGKVVMALDPRIPKAHVPFRDDKLTRLLQNSLGDNSYTTLLATLNAVPYNYDECLSTLQFANRCRNVRNNPRVNYIGGASMIEKDRAIKRLQAEISELKGLLASNREASDRRLRGILHSVGLEGSVLPDGRFQVSGGPVLGATGDASGAGRGSGSGGGSGSAGLASTSSTELLRLKERVLAGGLGGASSASASARSLSRSASGGRRRYQKSAEELQKLLTTTQEEVKLLREKLDSARGELSTVREESRKAVQAGQLECKKMRSEVAELQHQLLMKEREVEASLEAKRKETAEQLRQLAKNSSHVMTKQVSLLHSLPETLRVDSETLHRAADVETRVRREEEAKHLRLMKGLERSKDQTIQNLRNQYEYWLAKKESEARQFVADFNTYHAKQKQTMMEYKEEMLLLYDYCNALSLIVEKMERGSYPLKQSKSGIKAFAIPAKDKPDLALDDPAVFKHLRAQMAKASKVLGSIESGRPSSARSGSRTGRRRRLSTAFSPAMGFSARRRSSSALPPMDELPSADSAPPTRPSSSASGPTPPPRPGLPGLPLMLAGERPTTPLPQLFYDDGEPVDAAEMSEIQQLVWSSHDGLDLDSDVYLMDMDQLQEAVDSLRDFITTSMPAKLEETVLNNLADHPTIEYVKLLEEERDRYKERYTEEAKKLRKMTVSQQSHLRMIERLQQKIGGRGGDIARRGLAVTTGLGSTRASTPHSAIGGGMGDTAEW